MLNRWNLRVKAFQVLYAYKTNLQANADLAKALIEEHFTPDWNESPSPHRQEYVQQAQELFDQWLYQFQTQEASPSLFWPEPLRAAGQEAILFYQNQCNEDHRHYLKWLRALPENIFDLYLLALQIPEEARLLVQEEAQRQRDKMKITGLKPAEAFYKLAHSQVALSLRGFSALQKETQSRKLDWQKEKSRLRQALRDFMEQAPAYPAFDQTPDQDFEAERTLVLHMVREVAFRQPVNLFFEITEIDIPAVAWTEWFSLLSKQDLLARLQTDTRALVHTFLEHLALSADHQLSLEKQIYQRGQAYFNRLQNELKDRKASESLREYRRLRAKENPGASLDAQHFLMEQTLKQWLRESVAVLSLFLSDQKRNGADAQKEILHAFDHALFYFLEQIGLPGSSLSQLTLLVKNEKTGSVLSDFYAEQSLFWEEDQKVLQSMVQKTLKGLPATSQEEYPTLAELSLNWEDDFYFFEELFKQTVQMEKQTRAWISAKAENWDFTRLALTDRVILQMALTEMVFFPSIPVKVSINEYIDIAKQYSTPNSRQFINGLLDALSNELQAQKIIRKSGRGLMDNR
ncbi:MAG: hypothetical protein OHK0053_14910 [Microscillaceae bacterium]